MKMGRVNYKYMILNGRKYIILYFDYAYITLRMEINLQPYDVAHLCALHQNHAGRFLAY